MNSANRKLYATHPQATEALYSTASGGKFTPTVVNPADPDKPGFDKMQELALFYVHLLVWVVALALSCAANFSATGLMSNSSAVGVYNDGAGATSTTTTIGVIGGISTILGVGLLLGAASYFDAEEYKTQVWLNTAIQFLTLYGTTATLFIFCQAAASTSSTIFWLSLFAVMFCLYAQVLLYCTSATLEVLALPRAFIPSLAASVQFISALSISGDEFVPAPGSKFTGTQKFLAWCVPILTLVSVALMVGLRRFTRDAAGVSQLGDRPFLRSLVLTPFLLSGVLSVYKLSFVAVGPDSVAYMFTFFGMLLNFAIISVVFMPSSASSNSMQK